MSERLAALIRENQPWVVLTGAGVSTESGIPDFRSPTGIWARYDPMEYATIEAFGRDPELHERAGSHDVIEVHGSVRTSSCLRCGERVPLEEVARLLETAPAPPCPRCGAIVKPDVVM